MNRVESAYGVCNQRLKLHYDDTLSNLLSILTCAARAVQVDSIIPRVESAYGVCNQRLKLQYDETLSNLVQLRYHKLPMVSPEATI